MTLRVDIILLHLRSIVLVFNACLIHLSSYFVMVIKPKINCINGDDVCFYYVMNTISSIIWNITLGYFRALYTEDIYLFSNFGCWRLYS